MKNITLSTDRLILRPFVCEDFNDVHLYASDTENTKYMIWGPNNENETNEFINHSMDEWLKEVITEHNFAVILKENSKLIGGSSINIDSYQTASLGWILNKDYWKNGYCSELAHELINFGFEKLDLHRIHATCDSENYGSYRVMENNYMKREACFIKNRFIKNQWCSEFHYAILKEDWLKNKLEV